MSAAPSIVGEAGRSAPPVGSGEGDRSLLLAGPHDRDPAICLDQVEGGDIFGGGDFQAVEEELPRDPDHRPGGAEDFLDLGGGLLGGHWLRLSPV